MDHKNAALGTLKFGNSNHQIWAFHLHCSWHPCESLKCQVPNGVFGSPQSHWSKDPGSKQGETHLVCFHGVFQVQLLSLICRVWLLFVKVEPVFLVQPFKGPMIFLGAFFGCGNIPPFPHFGLCLLTRFEDLLPGPCMAPATHIMGHMCCSHGSLMMEPVLPYGNEWYRCMSSSSIIIIIMLINFALPAELFRCSFSECCGHALHG